MTDKFYLFANCNFVPDRYKDWQAAYDELAKYVWAEEPTTQTYYFGIPMEYADDFAATTSMLAFEVYGKREDLYTTHFNSPAMGGFLKKIPDTMTTGLDLAHYRLLEGYIDSSNVSTECGIMLDTRITCSSGAARKTLAPKLAALAKSVQDSKDKQILTFMVFESLDDDVNARIYARFSTRSAMEQYLRRPDVLNFWLGTKEEIFRMESHAYLPNGKGWLHRGGSKL